MNEIQNAIIPKKDERDNFEEVTNLVLKKLNKKLDSAKAILGGSGAKDTWLSGNHDVDIFVLYDYHKFLTKSTELSNLLEPILKKVFPKIKVNRVHGSRDYFQFSFNDFIFEIIPILNITKADEAANITDVSPLHSTWVNKKGRKLKNEIRLAKQFFKANSIYGAESHISGFSGYVIEILTIYYGSFTKLLQASKKWKKEYVIDVENHYAGKNVLFELNSSKHSPLIVIDPVDRSRNASAALNLEKVNLFKHKANLYLKKPSVKYFEKQEINLEILKKKAKKNKMVYIEFEALKGKGDVVGSKILKAYNFLQIKLNKFGIISLGWEMDKIYFILKKDKLPDFEERKGPPLNLVDDVKKFKHKNKNHYVQQKRIYAKIKIKHPKLVNQVKYLLEQDYFKEKVKKIKKIVII